MNQLKAGQLSQYRFSYTLYLKGVERKLLITILTICNPFNTFRFFVTVQTLSLHNFFTVTTRNRDILACRLVVLEYKQ